MDKDIIEKTKKITSMISHLYGWYFEAEKMDEEDEITISYEQGIADDGIPGNILKIVINEMEKIGFCFSRVSVEDESTIYFIFWYNPDYTKDNLTLTDTKNKMDTKEVNSFKGDGSSDFEGDNNIASEGAFKCVKCGKDADVWYVNGYEFVRHINGEPEDGHLPVLPEQTDADGVY